jgi:hypothetical protein
MGMLEFANPIPVVIKETKQLGYALYVTSSGTLENDVFCVVLCDGGTILHVLTNQIVIHSNKTFNITKQEL